MSATLDTAKFSEFFDGAPVFEIPGRCFDVDIHQLSQSGFSESGYVKKCIEMAMKVHCNEPAGDLVVFLTGQAEIEYACGIVEELNEDIDYENDVFDRNIRGLVALPLYASLEPVEQRKVFLPVRNGYRKVVFSTNIAATSITIPNILYIVDSGFVKQKEFDAQLDMDALVVAKISRAAADQRAGRAGRTAHGKCWRLYSREDYANMIPDTIPEIQRTGLIGTLLILKDLGISNVLEFPFMDAPDPQALMLAARQLFQLGALDRHGNLTTEGKLMTKFPISPKLSRALIESCREELSCSKEILTICACLSSEEITQSISRREHRDGSNHVSQFDQWAHPSGDHMTFLNITEAFRYHHSRSVSVGREFCRKHRFRYQALKATLDIESQLFEIMEKHSLPVVSCTRGAQNKASISEFNFISNISSTPILKALIFGFHTNLARKHHSKNLFYHYSANHGTDNHSTKQYLALNIAESSSLYPQHIQNNLDWILFHELSYSNKACMKIASRILYDWVPSELGARTLERVDAEILLGKSVAENEQFAPLPAHEEETHNDGKPDVNKRLSETQIDEAKRRYLERKRSKK